MFNSKKSIAAKFAKTVKDFGNVIVKVDTDYVPTFGATGNAKETLFRQSDGTFVSGKVDGMQKKTTYNLFGMPVFQEYEPFLRADGSKVEPDLSNLNKWSG